ncbi:MAG: DEAD/DEAH box helicase [Bacilli bacterium]|nr:DEAD/DEAH box helicase [Bacilli bacterium]
MENYIHRINDKEKCADLIEETISELFLEGAIDPNRLEVLTLVKIMQPEIFKIYENRILITMGLFFKPLSINSFEDNVFKIYWEYIQDRYKGNFTPVQADILEKISNNQVFSFSSPTSTGKSFILRYLLTFFKNDIVIIVPSRALINEYYHRVSEIINSKDVNILTFVDIINTKRAHRNIFIITPERTRDLFLLKDKLKIDLFMFDEAQLSDEANIRGMYYDSVVRRSIKYFSTSKFIFAYPFISNPDAQFEKNKINLSQKMAIPYTNMNVGQLFFSYDEDNNFSIFGIDNKKTGKKIPIDYNPLEKILNEGGTVLIYCAKAQIYDGRVINKFGKYLKYCPKITKPEALEIIEKIRNYIGASNESYGDYSSLMINLMKRGIVFHHGSLPLRVRMLIEDFTQKGFCRLCFATATLEQGINMPFDLVWIEKFEPSKPLDVKNLIGRAGRSTNKNVFDYGLIVIKRSSEKNLCRIIKKEIPLDILSQLDITIDQNDDYKEYKEAIRNGTFSEEYNLTETEIMRLKQLTPYFVERIISSIYDRDKLDFSKIIENIDIKKTITNYFIHIYRNYLNRNLTKPEESILSTAVKILFWRIRGKKFNQIVNFRYSYSARTAERKQLEKAMNEAISLEEKNFQKDRLDNLLSKSLTTYQMIPNKKISYLNLNYKKEIKENVKAKEVDYDRIVVDTYDYIDKLIGFRLGDVFFAAFDTFSSDASYSEDLRAKAHEMTNYIKYGTNDEKEIWLLRYGFEFEDMDWLCPIVIKVDEEEIVFKNLNELSLDQIDRIGKFID